MDSDFLNELSDEELVRITPTIFDTLQKIIRDLDEKNRDQAKLIEKYQNLTASSKPHFSDTDVLSVLQHMQNLAQTGDIIIETEGCQGHVYYKLKLEDLAEFLNIPKNKFGFRTFGSKINISLPYPHEFDYCNIVDTPEAQEYLQDFIF